MFIYYLTIFLSLSLGFAYSSRNISNGIRHSILSVFFIFIIIVYGFRNEVGVDWFNYIRVYERLNYEPFSIDNLELGYKFINVFSNYVGGNIYTVIFIATVLFGGFTLFSIKILNINPLYYFSIVAPFHLVMSGVNYIRQSLSLSIMILSFSLLLKGKKKSFIFLTLLAGSFHKSALVFLFFINIDSRKRFLITGAIFTIPIILYLMLREYNQYVETQMESAGFLLRYLFLVSISMVLILNVKLIKSCDIYLRRCCLLIILSLFFLLAISLVSSTMADRFSYYFIILGVIVAMVINNKLPDQEKSFINLKYYQLPFLWLTSMFAFTIWIMYSSYIENYVFRSYLFNM